MQWRFIQRLSAYRCARGSQHVHLRPCQPFIGVDYTIPCGKTSHRCLTAALKCGRAEYRLDVCYSYDQGGSRLHRWPPFVNQDSTGSESYTYDADGRMTQVSKVTNGQLYNIGYQYDAGGDVTQITYPSGRVVQQAYNAVGQLCQISPTATGCTGSTYYAGRSLQCPRQVDRLQLR